MRTSPLLLLAALALAGCAQTPWTGSVAPTEVPLSAPEGASERQFESWLAAERARVAQTRAAAQQRYHDDELACWHRFAVNDCLHDARTRRRAVLDAMRRQDLQLSALERQRRTARRERDIEHRSAPAR